jgi:hypothetical protein
MATSARPEQKLAAWNDPQAVPYITIDRVTKKLGGILAGKHVSR